MAQRQGKQRKSEAPQSTNGLLTPDEFCARTNMSRAKEDRLRRVEKVIPHYKIGGRIFYDEKHVEQFLKSCEQQPAAAA